MISFFSTSTAVVRCLIRAFCISPFRASSIRVVTDKNSAQTPNVSLLAVLTSIKNEPKPNTKAENLSAKVYNPELNQYFFVFKRSAY